MIDVKFPLSGSSIREDMKIYDIINMKVKLLDSFTLLLPDLTRPQSSSRNAYGGSWGELGVLGREKRGLSSTLAFLLPITHRLGTS